MMIDPPRDGESLRDYVERRLISGFERLNAFHDRILLDGEKQAIQWARESGNDDLVALWERSR